MLGEHAILATASIFFHISALPVARPAGWGRGESMDNAALGVAVTADPAGQIGAATFQVTAVCVTQT